MMAPSISVREYIRRGTDEKSEPTSTLVLTSAESRFVDTRILKPEKNADLPLDKGDVLPSSRLDWAFAGTSSTELRDAPDGKRVPHSTWVHWVSSQTKDPDSVKDDGDMIPGPNGTTMEYGSNVDPETGKVITYEECWKDVEIKAVNGAPGLDSKVCVVLQLHDDAHEARGMVVRLGQYVQGVIRVGDHFALERWEWKGASEGWKRLVRIEDYFLPCNVAMEEEKIRLGGEVKFGEFVWKVVELSTF